MDCHWDAHILVEMLTSSLPISTTILAGIFRLGSWPPRVATSSSSLRSEPGTMPQLPEGSGRIQSVCNTRNLIENASCGSDVVCGASGTGLQMRLVDCSGHRDPTVHPEVYLVCLVRPTAVSGGEGDKDGTCCPKEYILFGLHDSTILPPF